MKLDNIYGFKEFLPGGIKKNKDGSFTFTSLMKTYDYNGFLVDVKIIEGVRFSYGKTMP